jgi:hypothetical protein
MAGFIVFFIASGRSMFHWEDFGMNRCFLGRRVGVSPWLIAIFAEHMDLPQSVLHMFRDKIKSVTGKFVNRLHRHRILEPQGLHVFSNAFLIANSSKLFSKELVPCTLLKSRI